SADEAGVELATEHLALHLDRDRVEADDRELPLREQQRLDAHTADRAAELETLEPLDRGDRRGQREDEVLRVRRDVVPLDPDLVDVDREERRPLERVAAGRTDAQEHAETGARLERTVAEKVEVARLTRERERTDVDRRADRLEREHH